jgi:hypothetical protein
MRRTAPAWCSGFAVLAAALLLGACSGSGDGSSAATSSSAGTSQSTASRFCTEAASIQERVASTLNNPSQRANLPRVLQEASAEIRSIKAPPVIAGDWSALADGAAELAALIGSVDPSNPAAFAGIEQRVNDVNSRLTGASAHVSNYLRAECGIGPAPTRSASPTS